jgi:hypothetical protein
MEDLCHDIYFLYDYKLVNKPDETLQQNQYIMYATDK